MFIEFVTTKDEVLLVNVDKIFFFGDTKKKSVVMLEDGTLFELKESYESIVTRIKNNSNKTFCTLPSK